MTTNEQYQNAVEYVRKAFKSLGMNASEMQVHETAVKVVRATRPRTIRVSQLKQPNQSTMPRPSRLSLTKLRGSQ